MIVRIENAAIIDYPWVPFVISNRKIPTTLGYSLQCSTKDYSSRVAKYRYSIHAAILEGSS